MSATRDAATAEPPMLMVFPDELSDRWKCTECPPSIASTIAAMNAKVS